MGDNIRLSNADCIIQDAESFRHGADILITGSQIAAVRDTAGTQEAANEWTVVDCRGMLLMPGLVNAHTHLFQVLTRGLGKELLVREWARHTTYPVARKLTADEYYDGVLLACADAIRNGCTAVIDHPTHYARFHADQSHRAIMTSGLRGAVARGGADYSMVDAEEVRPLEEDLRAARLFVESSGRNERVQRWIGPSGFHSCTPKGLAAFKELATELGTRFHFHLAESRAGKEEAVAAGYRGEVTLAHSLGLLDERTSAAHAVWVEDDEVELLASSGCQIVHCPTSNMLLGSGIAPIPRMLSQGVSVALATDGPSSNDSMDIVSELKHAALLHRVKQLQPAAMGAKEVFRMSTQGGARVLGADRLGRIAEGYAADIIGLKLAGNPSLAPCHDPIALIAFCASGRDVNFVMVSGKILFQDGVFTTIDVQRTIARVQESLA